MSRNLSFYGLYHRICLSQEEESSLRTQTPTVTCYSGHVRKWILGLTSVVSQKADTYCSYKVQKIGEFFFPSLGRTLQLFSAMQVCRLYEMCQGIMNSPLYYVKVNLSRACDLLLVVLFYWVRAECTFFFKFLFVLNTLNKRGTVKTRKL
jgi:hypothetical protein